MLLSTVEPFSDPPVAMLGLDSMEREGPEFCQAIVDGYATAAPVEQNADDPLAPLHEPAIGPTNVDPLERTGPLLVHQLTQLDLELNR